MARHYVNGRTYDGHREVLRIYANCPRLANPENPRDLGENGTCGPAIVRANAA